MIEKQAKDLIFGFDVSGSAIRMQAYENTQTTGLVLLNDELIEQKITPGFANIMGSLKSMITDFVEHQKIDVKSLKVGLGVPARFEGVKRGMPYYEQSSCKVQQRVSGIHLGADCVGKNWEKELQDSLKEVCKDCSVELYNDAGAQLRTMLNLLQDTQPERYDKLKGKTVLYMGPGTGFGAAIADITRQGNVKVRLNSHAYDVLVEITPTQEKNLHTLFDGKQNVRYMGEHQIQEIATQAKIDEFERLDEQTYGKLFPLRDENGKKNLYILEKNGKKYIQPVRFFAGKDGIDHLLADEINQGAELRVLGKMTPEAMESPKPDPNDYTYTDEATNTAYQKLSLIGELMGNYIVQFQNGSLERLSLSKGVSNMPYDKGQQGLQKLGGVMLGATAMQDGIGAVLEQGIKKTTKQHQATAPEQVDYYRPCKLQKDQTPDHASICHTAAMQVTASQALSR